jgi:hypothetical protein
VAEVSIASGPLRPRASPRLDVDCGRVVNPTGARKQTEGAMNDAVNLALKLEITFDRGRVVQRKLTDYPLARMRESAPRIEGYLVESQKPPTGLGEIPVPPAGSNLVFEFSRVTSFATNKKTFRARTRKAFENFFESTFLDGALSSARRSLVLARVNRERADDLRIRLAKPDERFFSL